MKKINIAELLKDCPQGMELDCTMYDGLEFDSIDESMSHRPVKCRRKCRDGGYNIHRFSKYGLHDDTPHSKCVIFPKGKTTWEGFVPPCKFKDGDVISNSLDTCIFKGKGRIKGTVDYYCGVHADYFIVKDNKSNPDGHYGNIVDYRFATEEEKQKLFDTIKANGYKWNAETNTLEKLIKPKFKVGDKVKCVFNNYQYIITKLTDTHYTLVEVIDKFQYTEPIIEDKNWELVSDKLGGMIMESKIKWQTGEPYESGNYLVTMKDGTVSTLEWYNSYTGCKYWDCRTEEEVVAWCKLSDIEPYKE